jgi:hypothetical protein
VTFSEQEKLKLITRLGHPLSTKVIKKPFDVNSTGNLIATTSDLDSQAHTFMDDPRSKQLSDRAIMINQMSSPGGLASDQPLASRRGGNLGHNPFTFDSQEGEGSHNIIKVIHEDDSSDEDSEEEGIHSVIQSREQLQQQINEYQRKLQRLIM